MSQTRQRYVFIVEWEDYVGDTLWNFYLFCYEDDTMELWDRVKKNFFLKRVKLPGIVRTDIYLGKRLPVYSRTMVVKAYGDPYTKVSVEEMYQRTFALIQPDGYDYIAEILQVILNNDFKIIRMRMVRLNKPQVLDFYLNKTGEPIMRFLLALLLSGPMLALELQAPQARCKWVDLIGHEDPEYGRRFQPETIRAMFGQNMIYNAVHGPESDHDSVREMNIFFGTGPQPPLYGVPPNSAVYKDCSLLIIKPHLVDGIRWPQVLVDLIARKFKIESMQLVYLNRVNASDFYEIYWGLRQDVPDMVHQLSWGPCVVVCFTGYGKDTAKKLREACGPFIPLLARQLYPNTIRARHGLCELHNAVHCTENPNNGGSEVQYFFHTVKDKFQY